MTSMLNHLGIICDGNRRWAKARFLPRFLGHKAGYDNVKTLTKVCAKKGINYLTVWCLSVDNLLEREKDELLGLISLIDGMEEGYAELAENNVKIDTIGDLNRLSQKTQDTLERMKERTKNNTGIVLTLALVYGGQDEIVRATKKIIEAGVDPQILTREEFRKYLDISKLPVVDLIIRTGGDIRHSGFLLYDSEYTEYYFSTKFFPEFDEEELDKAIEKFRGSKRNFGR